MVGIGGDVICKAVRDFDFLGGEVVVVSYGIIAYMYVSASSDVAVDYIFLMR
jgi:hypothetical protein